MQLVIDGAPLDLLAGQKIQLTKENALFAFDNLKCERTTEITLPDTPTNNALLRAAKHAATRGEGMRTRYAAEMRDGLVVKRGDLYVTAYTGGAYKAVFVTGQLIGLQRLREAGNLPELVQFTDALDYPQQIPTPANQNANFWEVVYYKQDRSPLFPSMDAQVLAGAAAEAVGARIDWTGVSQLMRIVPDVAHGLSAQAVTIASTINDQTQPTSDPQTNYNAPSCSKAALFRTLDDDVNTRHLGVSLTYRVRMLAPKTDVRITFPDDFSDDLFLVQFDSGAQLFLGGYSFTTATYTQDESRRIIRKTGDPLAGRSVTIPRDSAFIICDCRDYLANITTQNVGWWFGYIGAGLSCSYHVHVADSTEEGATAGVLWAQDNLPDVSLVDLLKTFAAVSGRLLYYDNGTISFDACDVEAWPLVELRDVIKVDDIRRTFADYKRANIIEYDTAVNVPAWQKIRRVYFVDNEYLQAENVLQQIQFSEGAKTGGIYGDAFTNANAREDADKWGVALCMDAHTYMQRCALPANAGVERLCNESTAATITARLSLLEFEQITPKTALLCGGVRYVWTGATWEDGVAVFDAQKF